MTKSLTQEMGVDVDAGGARPADGALGTARTAGAAAPVAGEVAPAGAPCPSCAAPLVGKFCHACGEERADEGRDLSLKHFVGKSLNEITDFEHSKAFRTLAALLLRPGFLTNEYLAGRRNLYLTPLKICFIVFALYLFCYSFYRPAALFDIHRAADADRTGRVAAFLIDRQAAKKGIAPEAFVEQVNERWHDYMSLLQITGVLFFAVMLQLAYLRSGRYFVEHLIFSMHFLSFAFLFSVLLWPLNLLTGMGMSVARLLVTLPSYAIAAAYLFFALQRVYRQSTAATLFKTVILSVVYHMILAFLIMLTLMLAYFHVLTLGHS